ncbi:MAG TPA: VOC family protein [Candidatus Binatia bacterium]|jgi:catechol 2,3-dioxygenase-like lactoylglutathione lyase family enzyme|nr:VOC family protein [Candidatus Binatia bacterium]
MLGTSDLVAFVATTRPDEARKFYGGTLGLPIVGDDPAALRFDVHGVTLRVSKVQALTPAAHTVLGWKVTDIRAQVVALTAKGVAFERYGGMHQDQHGVWASPSGARVAWFKDPDGNLLSLTQEQ